MKKTSKFLGNLPSEQIFYRNVPLGAPVRLLRAFWNIVEAQIFSSGVVFLLHSSNS